MRGNRTITFGDGTFVRAVQLAEQRRILGIFGESEKNLGENL